MKKILISSLIIISVITIGICMFCKITEGKRFIKQCYFNNKNEFNYIAEFFLNNYEKSVNRIRYDVKSNELAFYYCDGNNTVAKCKDEYIYTKIIELKNKYREYSDYEILNYIDAYYDEKGKILLIIPLQRTQIKNKSADDADVHVRYLLYIDEDYSGKSSTLSIDNNGSIEESPFYEKWYFWSKNFYSG